MALVQVLPERSFLREKAIQKANKKSDPVFFEIPGQSRREMKWNSEIVKERIAWAPGKCQASTRIPPGTL